MKHLEREDQTLRQAEFADLRAFNRNPNGSLPHDLEGTSIKHLEGTPRKNVPDSPPNPVGKVLETALAETRLPYILEVEVSCDDCRGSGFDPGGIDPWGPEQCPVCRGAGTQRITKNYLGEALRIASNPECPLPVERAHLVAIVHYCRQAVSAVVSLPEVPEHARGRAGFRRSPRHRRAAAARTHEVTQIKRRKTNVDISPQRA